MRQQGKIFDQAEGFSFILFLISREEKAVVQTPILRVWLRGVHHTLWVWIVWPYCASIHPLPMLPGHPRA